MNKLAILSALVFSTSLLASNSIAQETAPVTETPATVEVEVSAPPVVALFPFQSRPKIDARVGAAMVRRLTGILGSRGDCSLLERSKITGLNSSLEITRKGYIKPESAAAWGTEHGVDYIVTGMVVAAGKGHAGTGA